MDEGWTRWLLDTYGVKVTAIAPDEVPKDGLTGYDALILPDVHKEILATGRRTSDGGMRYDEEMPPEFRAALGTAGADALRKFVEGGGTLMHSAIRANTSSTSSTSPCATPSRASSRRNTRTPAHSCASASARPSRHARHARRDRRLPRLGHGLRNHRARSDMKRGCSPLPRGRRRHPPLRLDPRRRPPHAQSRRRGPDLRQRQNRPLRFPPNTAAKPTPRSRWCSMRCGGVWRSSFYFYARRACRRERRRQ